jgi:hypothetical protein
VRTLLPGVLAAVQERDELANPTRADITSGSLQLICTVLAGFALTAVATMVTILDTVPAPSKLDHTRVEVAIALLACSIPPLLAATLCATFAQFNNYAALTRELQDTLHLHAVDFASSRERIRARWLIWRGTALLCYDLGVTLFLIGMCMLLWSVALWLAVIFALMVVLCTLVWWAARRASQAVPLHDTAQSQPPTPRDEPAPA